VGEVGEVGEEARVLFHVPRPSLCLQFPGRIVRVVQNSNVLTNPCSINTAAVEMVTLKGTDAPEKLENLVAARGRTSRV
jgi:hypothetical protein